MTDLPAPGELRVEGAADLLGVTAEHPRLSWTFPAHRPQEQTACRVLVTARSTDAEPDALTPETADWDSGWVETDEQTRTYDGPLAARTHYQWRVRVRDGDGVESPWSVTGTFETDAGPAAEWSGTWIDYPTTAGDGDDHPPSPYFRRTVTLDEDAEIRRARLYVAGAGFHEPWVNGERVGDRALSPGVSDYEERTLYEVVDVTDALRSGTNALGVAVGRGRFADLTGSVWRWNEAPWHRDHPTLLAELVVQYADGRRERVGTDGEWRARDGATRFDSLFEGERYDARREPEGWTVPGFDDTDWDSPREIDGPAGRLVVDSGPGIRVARRFDPASVERIDEDTVVYDAGVMTAGWTELAVEGEAGAEVEVTYGERRADDGTVDVASLWMEKFPQNLVDGRLQTDRYVCAGDGVETWTPRFSYRGFRYVQVRTDGDATVEDVTVECVHSAVEDGASGFACDDDLPVQIRENTRRALVNNFHSAPTDTPIYEKNGWTGDTLATAETALYEFGATRFYRKWLDDVADTQRETGEVCRIAPTSDWGYADGGQFDDEGNDPCPTWDALYPELVWQLYEHRGDERVLADHYEELADLFDFHRERADDLIVRTGHGDHVAPAIGGESASVEDDPYDREPPALVSTVHLYAMADRLASVADVLGRADDADRYRSVADDVAGAINDAFLDREREAYAVGDHDLGYRQTSNVLPLAFGLVPDEHVEGVVANLVADLESRDWHLNTGVIGTVHLFDVVTEHVGVDAAYRIATKRTYPSYGHWIDSGMTSLLEFWELHSRSRNHHMFGSVVAWFYRTLAGIEPAEPGYRTVRIAPQPPADLDSASADVWTPRGVVGAAWERTDGGLLLEASVPANCRATVVPPGADGLDRVTVDDRAPEAVDGVRVETGSSGGDSERAPVLSVPAGEWTINVDQTERTNE